MHVCVCMFDHACVRACLCEWYLYILCVCVRVCVCVRARVCMLNIKHSEYQITGHVVHSRNRERKIGGKCFRPGFTISGSCQPVRVYHFTTVTRSKRNMKLYVYYLLTKGLREFGSNIHRFIARVCTF